jgi:PIN domain nuclease of toxin-antitoxin system
MSEESVLLDTHTWLWLANGSERLQETKALKAIRAAYASGKVYLSVVSIWEIGMLASKNRIRARQDYRKWLDDGIAGTGVTLQPITPGIAWSSSFLPRHFHADPADRMLVATARELDVPLLTADANIIAYAQDGNLIAIEV